MNVNSKEFLWKNHFFPKAGGIKLMSLGQIYKQEIINLYDIYLIIFFFLKYINKTSFMVIFNNSFLI